MSQNESPQDPMSQPAPASSDTALRSVHTSNLPGLFEQLRISLVVSTYQAGKVTLIRNDGGALNTHFRSFAKPMGIAADALRLTIGGTNTVWYYRNQPAVAQKLEPAGKYDGCYLPRRIHVTGDIDIHELAWDKNGELWVVNIRFGCLCALDADHSFYPRWRPAFLSALAPEDRCHLNGLGLVDGRPRYVTTLGETDTAGGWRANKRSGGVLLDIETNAILLRGLSMPHSPRWYQGKLWFLESGQGSLASVDLLSDYPRGLAEHEWRWRTGQFTPFACPHPQWDGHPIPGKTLLIHTEQGAGDAIQFARYLPLAAERVGRLILVCRAELMPLFATLPGIAEIREPGTFQVAEFDTYTPLLSLPQPHLFGTTLETIPAPIPYLDVALLRRRKPIALPPPPATPRRKIGLVVGSPIKDGNGYGTD